MTPRAKPRAALVIALVCLAPRVRADPPSELAPRQHEAIALEYQAPPGCPDRGQFVERVHTFTSKAEIVAADSVPRRTFNVVLARAGSRTHGDLSIDDRGARSTRSVSGATCDEVVSALALATALAVDPDALSGAGSPEVPEATTELSTQTTEPSKPDPASPVLAKPAKPKRAPRPVHSSQPRALAMMDFGLGMRVANELAPFPLIEGSAQLGISYFAPLELHVGGAYGPSQRNAQARFSNWVGWVGVGVRALDAKPVSVWLQADVEYGQVRATGRTIPERTVQRPWAAADLGLAGRLEAPGPLFFGANFMGRAPFLLQRYVVTENSGQSREVHHVRHLGYLFGISVGIHFL